ncbi:MAG: 3-isopropylmalate dehydratase large subunit, partial [Selenomonadaceae bacterium]|nr:3-isopropylmalate dehydratase large subunit [Selenomonadaceae bacterium]
DLTISERMAMCNMTTEMGAKTSYIQPDEVTLKHLKDRGITDFKIYNTDDDYEYAADLTYDVTDIQPKLAAPFSVDNVDDIDRFTGKHVDQTYLGSCTGGRVQDFEIAAAILKGRQVHHGTRMVLVPASKFVLRECIDKGYIQTLLDAGATLTAPGCAACLGIHQGLLAEGEVCVSSTNRNFPGRMGSVKGEIYLGSPASVAAAALEGVIADPRKYL